MTTFCFDSPFFVEHPKQADLNDVTRQFADLVKAVDSFHFKKGVMKLSSS